MLLSPAQCTLENRILTGKITTPIKGYTLFVILPVGAINKIFKGKDTFPRPEIWALEIKMKTITHLILKPMLDNGPKTLLFEDHVPPLLFRA